MKNKKYFKYGCMLMVFTLAAIAAGRFLSDYQLIIERTFIGKKEYAYYESTVKAVSYANQKNEQEKVLQEKTIKSLCDAYALDRLSQKYLGKKRTSYLKLEEEKELFNKQREKAAAKGDVVYGPTSLGLMEFIMYQDGNLEMEIIDAMAKYLLDQPDLLKEAYDGLAASELVLENEVTLTEYSIESEEWTEHREETMDVFQTLLGILDERNIDQEQAAALFQLPIKIETFTINTKGLSREDSNSARLLEQSILAGEGTAFIQGIEGSAEHRIYRVDNILTAEKPSFSESKQVVASIIAGRLFEKEFLEVSKELEGKTVFLR